MGIHVEGISIVICRGGHIRHSRGRIDVWTHGRNNRLYQQNNGIDLGHVKYRKTLTFRQIVLLWKKIDKASLKNYFRRLSESSRLTKKNLGAQKSKNERKIDFSRGVYSSLQTNPFGMRHASFI